MPVPYSVNELKARFQLGDVPSEQDFADLIDTINYWFQNAQTTANGAVVTANQALAQAIKTFYRGTLAGTGATDKTKSNIAATLNLGNIKWRFTFSEPFLDANYIIIFPAQTAIWNVTAQTTTYFEVLAAAGVLYPFDIEFAVTGNN